MIIHLFLPEMFFPKLISNHRHSIPTVAADKYPAVFNGHDTVAQVAVHRGVGAVCHAGLTMKALSGHSRASCEIRGDISIIAHGLITILPLSRTSAWMPGAIASQVWQSFGPRHLLMVKTWFCSIPVPVPHGKIYVHTYRQCASCSAPTKAQSTGGSSTSVRRSGLRLSVLPRLSTLVRLSYRFRGPSPVCQV